MSLRTRSMLNDAFRWWARCALGFVLIGAQPVPGENWAQWRGPFLNGSSSETNLPAQWSKTENVLWKTPLPGRSGATPVVWKDFVFVPTPDEAKDLWLYCIHKGTGEVRWKKLVGPGDREQGKNNMASCSPVTDGKRVFTLFGTGDLAAFDFDGNELWKRSLKAEYGTFAVLFLYGSSPLLYQDRLYLQILQRNPPTYSHARDENPERRSVLLCLDPATGRSLWEHERKTDAREEAKEAYTTLLPYSQDGVTALVCVGADAVTAHEPGSGRELWRFAGLNVRKNPGGRIVPSPVAVPGLLFACGPKRETLVALRGTPSPMMDTNRLVWRASQYVPDVCTPLAYRDRLYVLDGDRQMMTCYQPASGEIVWQGRLDVREIFYASPTGADGKIYCLSEEGTAVVLAAGDKLDVLATIPMGEGPCRSSVVASDGKILIRTAHNLYCVGKETQ